MLFIFVVSCYMRLDEIPSNSPFLSSNQMIFSSDVFCYRVDVLMPDKPYKTIHIRVLGA